MTVGRGTAGKGGSKLGRCITADSVAPQVWPSHRPTQTEVRMALSRGYSYPGRRPPQQMWHADSGCHICCVQVLGRALEK